MVLSVTVVVTGQTLIDRFASIDSQLPKIMKGGQQLSAKDMVQLYRAASPVRSGRLRNSWRSKITGRFVSLKTEVEHARYVMEGTGIYGPRRKKIVPQVGRKMAFKKEGRMLFLTFTRGMKAQKIEPSMNSVITKAGNRIVDDIIVTLNS